VKVALDTASPVVAIVSEPPVMVEPVVPLVVTLTEFAVPRLETTLPRLSVTATFAMKVPLLPSVVIVQVKRQGEPRTPALIVGADQPYLAAAPALTVRATALAVEMLPSVALSVAAPDLAAFSTPFFAEATVATPEVKVSAVAVPMLTTVPAELTTVAAVPPGLSSGPVKVMLWEPV